MDVIDQIAKEPDQKITQNGPRLHEFIRELSRETFQKGALITVGEAWGADVERAKLYSNPDGSEFSMVFQFEHIHMDQLPGKEKWDLSPLRLVELKQVYKKWQTGLYNCGWNSLFWNNHDLPRIVSRWGNDKEYRVESAKMLATVLHGMQGTPYIYEGEELGMTNVGFTDISQYRDIETMNMYRERKAAGYSEAEILKSLQAKSRDNGRTPMQWSDEENAGFTTGTPWISVNSNYHEINAEKELADPDSVFCYYQKLIHLRKENRIFLDGAFTLLAEQDQQIFAYTRTDETEELLVCANFTKDPADAGVMEAWKQAHPDAELLIHNYKEAPGSTLKPYEAVIYRASH